jgi:hypothetical protein
MLLLWCWQCSESMTFWCDPCLWLMDPDEEGGPAVLSLTFKTPTKDFSAYYFLKVNLHHFSKIKSPKVVIKHWELRFFCYLCFDDRKIRIREAQKHVDPDPEHWMLALLNASTEFLAQSWIQRRLYTVFLQYYLNGLHRLPLISTNGVCIVNWVINTYAHENVSLIKKKSVCANH